MIGLAISLDMLQPKGAGGGALAISGNPVVIGTQNIAYPGFSVSGSGGTGPYSYSVQTGTLPTGLSLNTATGAVTGTPTVVQTKTGIVLRVTDSLSATADLSAFQIAVRAPVTISGTPVTTATQNSAYAGFSATASGGSGGYVYSISAGALPAGISLNASTGAVSGTPTVAGAQTGIVIRATDSEGRTADLAAFTLTVSASGGATNRLLEDGTTRILEDGTTRALET